MLQLGCRFAHSIWWSIAIFSVCLAISPTVSKAANVTEKKVVLRRCEDFEDNRNVSVDEIVITVPGNLTNNDKTLEFGLDKIPYKLPCDEYFTRDILWEEGTAAAKTFGNVPLERLGTSGKWSTHFTHEGYFHDNTDTNGGPFYKPDDYCVKSINDSSIELQICQVNCEEGNRNKFCIPKCCGPDEVLVYWKFICRKVTPHDRQRWKPRIYKDAYPHDEITDSKELDKRHFYRQRLRCNNTNLEKWPLSNTLRPLVVNYSRRDKETYWRLRESLRPVYLKSDRQWAPIAEGNYCVDGYANWGFGGDGNYSGDPELHSVLLLCTDQPQDNFNATTARTYSIALLFFSLFILLTIIVHLMLLDKQHLHGLTVLCHSTSMFFLYVFLALAHIASLHPAVLKGDEPRGPLCMVIAILTHYFFMTTFTWLTVMNFDLWLTFRSMRPVSKLSKRIRRFWLYFTIGWGLPALLIGGFYSVDEVYRSRRSRVVVPDYADKNCFVAIWSRGHYVYSLVAIALSINTVLVAWTFYIFYEFRKHNANTFTSKRARADKYSVRLFIKIFCVMGVAWFVELLSWKYNGEEKPLVVVILDLVMFFQAFAIFFIFCMNRRTLQQLEEKYPQLRTFIGPIRKFRWFKSYSEVDGVEMTTPGSTPRKLSVSVTNITKNSTLPRKSSTSSARSVMSSNNTSCKYGNLGIAKLETLESVSLDSEGETGAGETHTLKQAPDLITNT